MPQKIPATIVTGFLGAGKTTLIRRLIERADRRIALIVNEFGDVGVDGTLLAACGVPGCTEDDVVELANGCICCTVADDFLPAMTKILARDPAPEHIVIETSGLALPKPLVRAFNWPEVKTRVTVDGVVAVIDGAAAAEGLFSQDEAALAAQRAADPNLDHESPLAELFEEQVACADLIVLNKMDQLDEAGMARAEAALEHDRRPGAAVLKTSHGMIPPSVLLGLHAAAEDDLDSRHSHHDDGEDHDHDDFEAHVLELGTLAEPDAFAARARKAITASKALRLKGVAAVEGRDMRLIVQAVGPRVETYFDRPWNAGEARVTRLVAIGEAGFDVGALRAGLGA